MSENGNGRRVISHEPPEGFPSYIETLAERPKFNLQSVRDGFLERPLPSNTEGERAILGAVLLNNDLMDEALDMELSQDDFYSPFYQAVYEGMRVLRLNGKKIDPIIVGEELKKVGKLESYGGVAAIANLTYGLPHFNNIGHYVKLVQKKAQSRNLIKACNTIISEALAEDDDEDRVLEKAEQLILMLSSGIKTVSGERKGFVDLKDLAPKMRERFVKFHNNELTALPTGYDTFDEMLDGGGLQNKALYVFAGDAKSGKTALTLGAAYNIAEVGDVKVLIVSEEMDKLQLAQRLYSRHSGVPYYFFRAGLRGEPYKQALTQLDTFAKMHIAVSDTLRSMPDIRTHCRREVIKGHKPGNKRIGLIIVDYMQLVVLDELDRNPNINEVKEVSEVSRQCKLMAQELDVPVIGISNLNRLGLGPNNGQSYLDEKVREAPRPTTKNLRNSGQIEFDAEVIAFTYNPLLIPGVKYERPEVEDITLIVDRQRNGPTGDIPLKFIGKYMRFLTPKQYSQILNHEQMKTYDTRTALDKAFDNDEEFD